MIAELQKLKDEHGDLDIYENTDWGTVQKRESRYKPYVRKIHYKKFEDDDALRDELHYEDVDVEDKDIYDVDLTRPIVKGIMI